MRTNLHSPVCLQNLKQKPTASRPVRSAMSQNMKKVQMSIFPNKMKIQDHTYLFRKLLWNRKILKKLLVTPHKNWLYGGIQIKGRNAHSVIQKVSHFIILQLCHLFVHLRETAANRWGRGKKEKKTRMGMPSNPSFFPSLCVHSCPPPGVSTGGTFLDR